MSEKKPTTKEVKETLGLKETKEIFTGLMIITKGAGEILEDGKISFKDLNPAIEVLKQYEALSASVKDAGKAIDELKDLSDIELMEMGKLAYDLIKEIRKAF